MVKLRRGKIINIASVLAFFGSGVVPSYSASKGALDTHALCRVRNPERWWGVSEQTRPQRALGPLTAARAATPNADLGLVRTDLETTLGGWPAEAAFLHRQADHFSHERLAEPANLGVRRRYHRQRATGAADHETVAGALHLRQAAQLAQHGRSRANALFQQRATTVVLQDNETNY